MEAPVRDRGAQANAVYMRWSRDLASRSRQVGGDQCRGCHAFNGGAICIVEVSIRFRRRAARE
jgi:hypothetical protein